MPTHRTTPRTRGFGLFATLLLATGLVAHATTRGTESAAPIAPQTPRIEVAFVLDTTGSMSGLIEGAKRKIWSIANQMASGQPTPEIRVGLVAYRDRGDAYVTRLHDLTPDLDAVYAELQQLRADGGGDTPESVNQALHEALTRLSWSDSPDVYRVVFLVGDAPPHSDYADDVPYLQTVSLARQRGIAVNTVQCGDHAPTTPIWQAIAEGGGGQYVAIRQDGGMLAMTTPMDDELARLNRELADTVIAYGAAGEQAALEEKRRNALAADAPEAASRLGALAKLGERVFSGRSDLVDAVKDGLADLADLDDDELPAEMKPMAPAERESYVQQKLEARKVVQQRIGDLSKERDAYVRSEQDRLAAAGEGTGFDQKVVELIRRQAADVGIAY